MTNLRGIPKVLTSVVFDLPFIFVLPMLVKKHILLNFIDRTLSVICQ